MPLTIACLHAAESNIALFEAAAGPALRLRHAARPDLLAAAEARGGLDDHLSAKTAAALRDLAPEASVALLTCSTLGPAADGAGYARPTLRADAALAREAVSALTPGEEAARPARLCVLFAAPSTEAATRRLFTAETARVGATAVLRLVAGAWPAFHAGDRDGYLGRIADAIAAARQDGFAVVALAQASMAPAADATALTAPAAALRAARRASEMG